ncbi:MAG TPA: alpha/beta hydrolase [Pseudolabrys sp.]|nr:alpha/beta hydrolase [Pseudolabrys sp.]
MSTIAITSGVSRRAALAGGAVLIAAPALAAECRIGPPAHDKGPDVWMGMDQIELDASYDQSEYAPLGRQIIKRYASSSAATRARLGEPQRVAYGPTEPEKLDIFRAKASNAPVYIFVHGGAWLGGAASGYAFPAEMFVHAGAHYIALDFVSVKQAGGDLGVMAEQVRRAIAWVYKNAEQFGGDRQRLYVGGHSSGGHLAGVAAITDWQSLGLPANPVRGWHCMSGMFDMRPVRLSKRSSYINFTDAMEDAMSTARHIDRIKAPMVLTTGTNETPDFQRQTRDFAAKLKAAGKPAELVVAPDYNHFEMCETLGNPYGPNGRAALKLMELA